MASISMSHSDSASDATPMRVLAGGVPFAKNGLRVADNRSIFKLVVHDIGRDLHNVGVGRANGREREANIVHRLRCLRSPITRTERSTLIDGYLSAV